KVLNKPVKEDDFIAQDYLPGFAAPCPAELAEAYERVNKEIAHLTAERSRRKNNKQWEFLRIAKQVEDEVAAFLQRVPDEQLEPGILAYKKSRAGAPTAPVETAVDQPTLTPITSASTVCPPPPYKRNLI
ncbi:MAG TPA: hypothetical protein VH518_19040, partial [Tepidisphaeraceae bacterium]